MIAEKETVLIVDDEADVRAMLTGHLESKGYAVIAAENGARAFEVLEARYRQLGTANIKAIVCDWVMPGSDGIELLTRLRQSPHQATPFILMSGAVTREDLMAASKYDPDAIMLKPFSLTVLMQKLQTAVEAREAKLLARLLAQGAPR